MFGLVFRPELGLGLVLELVLRIVLGLRLVLVLGVKFRTSVNDQD